jgi:hypothetical protein
MHLNSNSCSPSADFLVLCDEQLQTSEHSDIAKIMFTESLFLNPNKTFAKISDHDLMRGGVSGDPANLCLCTLGSHGGGFFENNGTVAPSAASRCRQQRRSWLVCS